MTDELKRKYEALMKRCERCRDPSICPKCNIARQLVDIASLL